MSSRYRSWAAKRSCLRQRREERKARAELDKKVKKLEEEIEEMEEDWRAVVAFGNAANDNDTRDAADRVAREIEKELENRERELASARDARGKK